MRILLCTPIHPQLPFRLQAQGAWVQALKILGHQVKIFPLTGFKLFTAYRLHRAIDAFKPDHVFFSAGKDAVLPLPHTVFFSGVPFSTLSRHEQVIGMTSKLVVTNDPEHTKDWLKRGTAAAICLPISAINPKVHRRLPPVKHYLSDVCFVGSLSHDRQLILSQLLGEDFNLKVWGHLLPGQSLLPQLQPVYQGPAWGRRIAKIFSSTKLALNFVPAHMPTGGNMRTFEIPGCGALQLASRTDPSWFIPGKEIVLFSTLADLRLKIRYHLTHDDQRQRIAQAGYRRAHRDHTYQQRFAKVLKLLSL